MIVAVYEWTKKIFAELIEHLGTGPLIIGGKSMGGRVASMVADQLFEAGRIAGLVCLGYPFHPPGKPEKLRTAHLEGLQTPTLICQGTRDEFGTRDEVLTYALAPSIEPMRCPVPPKTATSPKRNATSVPRTRRIGGITRT